MPDRELVILGCMIVPPWLDHKRDNLNRIPSSKGATFKGKSLLSRKREQTLFFKCSSSKKGDNYCNSVVFLLGISLHYNLFTVLFHLLVSIIIILNFGLIAPFTVF